MPQGPVQAVMPAVAANQGPELPLGGGSNKPSGWPASFIFKSSTGPLSVISLRVWQSAQPPSWTRYLPRATKASAGLV